MVYANNVIIGLYITPVFGAPAVPSRWDHVTGISAAKVWVVIEAELQAGVIECGLPVGHDEQCHDGGNDAKYRHHDVVNSYPLDQKSV